MIEDESTTVSINGWPLATTIIAGLVCIAWMISSSANCSAQQHAETEATTRLELSKGIIRK
jgi:hypothetical protein